MENRCLILILLFMSSVCQAADPSNYGFTGGLLTVPFKWHPNDKAITGGGTLGGYLGYRKNVNGLNITPIVSGGLALSDSKYGTGFSLATGLIGQVGTTGIHLGVITGTDWYAVERSYPYNGKLWLALEIGFDFGG